MHLKFITFTLNSDLTLMFIPVWRRNRLLSAGLETFFSQTVPVLLSRTFGHLELTKMILIL